MSNEQWALLWSARQNAFHIEPHAESLRKNMDAFMAKRHGDYVPLHVGPKDECQRLADYYRPMLEERERIRAAAVAVVEAMGM